MRTEQLVYISLPTMTIGLITVGVIVTQAPPIARWAVGKNINYVLNYFLSKNATIIKVTN